MLPLVSVSVGTARRVGPNVPVRGVNAATPLRALALLALCAVVAACGDGGSRTERELAGQHIEVLAVWEDVEAEAFRQVLDRFEDDTGAVVTFTSTAGEDVTAVLDRRLAAGDPPDLAVLPQPGLLRRYARAGAILPLDELVGDVVRDSFAPIWQRLGSVDGVLHGVWFKAANKSLVWYSLGAFERAGLVPPDDLDGLLAVARELAEQGLPAFSLTGAPNDAWTLTDWFENLYLRIAGPERYDALAEHELAWTHPSVAETLAAMAELLAPGLVTSAPDASFPDSVEAVFSARPKAAMVVEGDFVPGVVSAPRRVELGVDVDVFDFPGRRASDRFVVGGGDAAVLMRSSPAAEALVQYLASTEAAAVWAALGGFLSPNEDLDLGAYPDTTTRRIARSLLEAGDGFRFDLSDLAPAAFGGTTGAGMWGELAAFVADPSDVAATAARLEAAAEAAWAGP